MSAVSAQGASFTFGTFSGLVTGLSVTTPTAEIADMTGVGNGSGQMMLVATGAWSGGEMTVELLSAGDPQGLVRTAGIATFTSPRFSINRRVICESATIEARTGELVRSTLKFRLTDA